MSSRPEVKELAKQARKTLDIKEARLETYSLPPVDNYITACNFLNKNLENHFKKKKYSLLGTDTAYDARGERYISYASHWCEPALCLPDKLDGLYSFLKVLLIHADVMVDGLIIAKCWEKKEEGTEIRDVIVDWRSFPSVEIDDNGKLRMAYRISVYHK